MSTSKNNEIARLRISAKGHHDEELSRVILGTLIHQLQALKEHLGEEAPVLRIEFGSLVCVQGSKKCGKGVIIQ